MAELPVVNLLLRGGSCMRISGPYAGSLRLTLTQKRLHALRKFAALGWHLLACCGSASYPHATPFFASLQAANKRRIRIPQLSRLSAFLAKSRLKLRLQLS